MAMQQDRLIAGYISEKPTVFSSIALGTTAVKATTATPVLGKITKIQITNTHATQLVAWTLEDAAATASTVVATEGNALCGSIVPPGQSIFFSIPSSATVWVVGSAASTKVCVTSYSV